MNKPIDLQKMLIVNRNDVDEVTKPGSEELIASPITDTSKAKIVVTATFTAEPLERSLNFWIQELQLPFQIDFAPYNQVFQELLDPSSLLSLNQDGTNIVLIRLEDWKREETDTNLDNLQNKIRRNVNDLVTALKSAAIKSKTPLLVYLCSNSPITDTDSKWASFFEEMSAYLKVEFAGIEGIYLTTAQELAAIYPVNNYYDEQGDKRGHIPFTADYFTALATSIARKIAAIKRAPYKVIVLDCDNTLWKGICGEVGAAGIEIDPPRRQLQEFLIAQQQAGMLLCLCSKNNERDAIAVFEKRQDMPLKLDHLVSWRINWQAKSENIQSLASELQLGLDSFIFIDDNPVECMEVEVNCPEVLTLELPQQEKEIEQFIAHTWVFDRLKITQEDKNRTKLYQQNVRRDRSLQQALTFQDFLAGLDLKIEIEPIETDQISRVSQLTQRTNQFNLTTIRRSESEISRLITTGEIEILIVRVKDRFGDYGLVGAIFYQQREQSLDVDTFLLSCRVLGRGVEHKMLSQLAEIAGDRGLENIEEVLSVRLIGIENNFFALGGNSLIATQVISRLEKDFAIELPLQVIFEFSTIAELAQKLEHNQIDRAATKDTIKPIIRDGNLPLSFAQQRMWLLDRLEPDSPWYNISKAVRLEGFLKIEILEQSLREIVKRHETLRTNFKEIDGEPIQIISTEINLPFVVTDLSAITSQLQSAKLQNAIDAEIQKPFDLSNESILRINLLKISDREHILILCIHHIAADGWSMDIIVRELTVLYQAFLDERPSPLPALSIQYVDFADWQRQQLQGEVLEEQLDYWNRQLEGSLPVLELPTDRPRPAIQQSDRGARENVAIPKQLLTELKQLSSKQECTLFMTLLAAFQVLLYRYSGQEDICIGSPIANRNRLEIEPLIGFFVNTLVLHGNLAGNPTFIDFLARVRQTSLDAYTHQDLPFEKLVEELQPERNLSYHPIFQVMFILQNTPTSALTLSVLSLTPLEIYNGTSKFDLKLEVTEIDDEIKGWFEYNSDLFNADTIARMAVHWIVLLEGIVTHPEQKLSELPLLTEAERHQILVEWNDNQVDYNSDRCIHQLFEERVEQNPDALETIVFERDRYHSLLLAQLY
jgi:FkbH-like protein